MGTGAILVLLLAAQSHGQSCEAECAADCTKLSVNKARIDLEEVKDVRLPTHLTPITYSISLTPFILPGNFTIQGRVQIEMECVESAANITLHAAELNIENDTITVVDKDGTNVNIVNIAYDEDREFIIIHLNESLTVGKSYVVSIKYTGYLQENLKGFYRSSYTDEKTNKTEFLASTQFQISDARRAFPCFDEPAIKATFKVSIGRRKDMRSISNMPIEHLGVMMKGTDEYVWDHYQESVKMSTYLLAFVVSKFDFTESTQSSSVRFRIWSDPNLQDQTEYAQEIGPKILKIFEDFFNLPYPLPKLDMIAVPDFGAGAMENWGLIVFKDSFLLYKEGVSSIESKHLIAHITSHELAHQWFGNLVTPAWWTDLWLNEGFATYMGFLGAAAAQPESRHLEQFAVKDLQDVFSLDALKSSHPVSVKVNHPDEIAEIFDKISYKKGASIIRMMNHYLSTETFRKGLSNYLKDLQFGAAEQDDLWAHLTAQGHRDGKLDRKMDVKTIMDTWTLQTGFPVVSVTRNYRNKTARLTQHRFLVGEPAEGEEEHGWWIPITFSPAGGNFENTYSTLWMEQTEKSKEISGLPESGTPVVFNIQQTGYYRVNYDSENWALLAATLVRDHTDIHMVNRAQLLDDAFNLAKSGMLDYETALSLTAYLHKEEDYVPWKAALNGLDYIKHMLKTTPAYGDFKRYMLTLIDPLYSKLGSDPKPSDSSLDVLLRSLAVDWACAMGNTDCLEKAKRGFSIWMDRLDPDIESFNPIDVNLRSQTYCYAIASGGEAEFNFAWERYRNSQVASEKQTILAALSCTKEVWLLNRYLNMSITQGSGVKKGDGYNVMGDIASNTIGRCLAFDFISDQWERVHELYGEGAFFMSKLMKKVLANWNTEIELKKMKAFVSSHRSELGTAARTVTQAIESTESDLGWMRAHYENIWDWLRSQGQGEEERTHQTARGAFWAILGI